MKQDLIKDVILGMLPYLNNAQNEKLQEVLRYTLAKYEVTGNQNKEKYSEQNYIELFISAKRIEGCSEKSLKGSKERVVYFDARTKIHLQNYLDSRTDDNPALFVSLKLPHKRLKIGGVEVRLRQFGKQLGINKVHPHKFRRTLATVAIDKGMPIEQLQQLLGHRKIDTTLQYAMVKQSNVKIAHRKYIG